MMFELKKLCKFSLFATIAAISGCGGEEDQSIPSPTPESTPMIVMDGFSTVTPKTKAFIDLSPFIRGSDVRISGVYTDSSNAACGTPTVEGRGINVEIEEGAYCQFTYSAQQTGLPHAKATLNVLATEAPEPTLPPISQAMVLGGASAKFNIQALLGADWKDSYTLNTASVQVQGMEGNLGSVNATGNIISFTPPELSGWNRVIFTLDDAEAPEASVVGAVYVTISEAVNQSPQIGEPKYDYGANHTSLEDKVFMGESKTLNLETLTGLNISEPDSQEWQLVSVQSFTASVSAASPNSVTNKSFEFLAPTVGDHYVSYIIADHYGGYSAGLIKIAVFAKGGAPTWADITTGGNTYVAPQTYEQATESGYIVSALWDEPVNNTVAGYFKASASSYCSTIGLIPSIRDYETLRAGPKDELQKWPKSQLYLALSNNQFFGYNLSDGSTLEYSPTHPYYLTCITNNEIEMKMLTYTIIANGSTQELAEVSMYKDEGDFSLSRIDGTLNLEQAGIEKGAKTDRTTLVTASSLVTGNIRFQARDNTDEFNVVNSAMVRYIGDPATAQLKLSVTRETAPPTGTISAHVVATLTDINDNPVEGLKIDFTLEDLNPSGLWEAKFTTIPESSLTDEKGQILVKVTDRNQGIVIVHANYTLPDGTAQTKSASVQFNAIQYPCNDGSHNCLPSRPSVNTDGILYVPPPSIEWAQNNGIHDDYLAAGYVTSDTLPVANNDNNLRGYNTYFRHPHTPPTCEPLNKVRALGRVDWKPLMSVEGDEASSITEPELIWKKDYDVWHGPTLEDEWAIYDGHLAQNHTYSESNEELPGHPGVGVSFVSNPKSGGRWQMGWSYGVCQSIKIHEQYCGTFSGGPTKSMMRWTRGRAVEFLNFTTYGAGFLYDEKVGGPGLGGYYAPDSFQHTGAKLHGERSVSTVPFLSEPLTMSADTCVSGW
ncbi:Ig-like domain-containing protein [Vibrio parahaemolyticus]|uniref:Ig-like domain-containing protein n=1 Tax=Vibrio parahaemolyticus TaxID=670 RepID=UPI0022EA1715|nr:hypothetical protein [Vibrio parahaemolyticus]